jgi:8-oxo-dGTP pyrophosphatase MutT (NUDIX family)
MRGYNAIGRWLSPIASLFRQLYSRISPTPRTRILVVNENNEVLLVRNWIGSQEWELPGGGVRRNEDLAVAARRELFEETGIRAKPQDLVHLGLFSTEHFRASIYMITVQKSLVSMQSPQPLEIVAIEWFPIAHLPRKVSPLVSKAVIKVSKKT